MSEYTIYTRTLWDARCAECHEVLDVIVEESPVHKDYRLPTIYVEPHCCETETKESDRE